MRAWTIGPGAPGQQAHTPSFPSGTWHLVPIAFLSGKGGNAGPTPSSNSLGHEWAKQADRLVVDARQWLPGVYRIRLEAPDGPHTLSITKVR